MKRIVCELCESMDIVKDGGFFVCQGCGTKYTAEQARAMMKEVEGDAPVASSAPAAAAPAEDNEQKIASLLTLARSSFDSKNYAQAEGFCNQIIALDERHFEAWKLKGEAINYQITASNQRILEVYNCIMTAYRVLDDKGKEQKMFSLLKTLKECLEGEVLFWVEQFESKRPTNAALKRTKDAYEDARRKMISAFTEFGIPGAKDEYLVEFDNMFIRKCNVVCASAWKTTVGYNYYRDYLDVCNTDPFTRTGTAKKWIIKDTDLWRPMKNTWDTFIQESDNMIDLLKYAERRFNHETGGATMAATYSWIAYIQERVGPSTSWKITQGYTSTWDEYKSVGWYEDYSLTDTAKELRRKEALAYRYKQSHADDEARDLMERKERSERAARIKAYWEAHPEEKAALEAKKADLTGKKTALEEKIAAVDEQIDALKAERDAKTATELVIDDINAKIRALEIQRSNLGIFAGKEKKRIDAEVLELRAQIQGHLPKVDAEKKERADAFAAKAAPFNEEKGKLTQELEALNKEIDAVSEELTKDRN